jgi:hypothetical protein
MIGILLMASGAALLTISYGLVSSNLNAPLAGSPYAETAARSAGTGGRTRTTTKAQGTRRTTSPPSAAPRRPVTERADLPGAFGLNLQPEPFRRSPGGQSRGECQVSRCG